MLYRKSSMKTIQTVLDNYTAVGLYSAADVPFSKNLPCLEGGMIMETTNSGFPFEQRPGEGEEQVSSKKSCSE